MSTIGIIGSGNIGATFARLAVLAGHDVVLSNSRPPETLWPLAAALGPRARAATAQDAAEAGDMVLVSVPFGRFRELPAAPLAGRIVLDTCNYYPDRDGHTADLDGSRATTSGLVQQHLAGAQVVKVLNNIWFHHLGAAARPSGAADRSTLPIASDHPAAATAVRALVDQLGYDTHDTGGLVESWRFERDQPAYVAPYGPFDATAATTPVTQAALADALARAVR